MKDEVRARKDAEAMDRIVAASVNIGQEFGITLDLSGIRGKDVAVRRTHEREAIADFLERIVSELKSPAPTAIESLGEDTKRKKGK
jgi:hypothetical protein